MGSILHLILVLGTLSHFPQSLGVLSLSFCLFNVHVWPYEAESEASDEDGEHQSQEREEVGYPD